VLLGKLMNPGRPLRALRSAYSNQRALVYAVLLRVWFYVLVRDRNPVFLCLGRVPVRASSKAYTHLFQLVHTSFTTILRRSKFRCSAQPVALHPDQIYLAARAPSPPPLSAWRNLGR
jgi:hypothetical protein